MEKFIAYGTLFFCGLLIYLNFYGTMSNDPLTRAYPMRPSKISLNRSYPNMPSNDSTTRANPIMKEKARLRKNASLINCYKKAKQIAR